MIPCRSIFHGVKKFTKAYLYVYNKISMLPVGRELLRSCLPFLFELKQAEVPEGSFGIAPNHDRILDIELIVKNAHNPIDNVYTWLGLVYEHSKVQTNKEGWP